ncbi:MAG: biotin/lipoyl-containing protein, partial [Pseudomonadota bacterium]
MAVTEVKVPDVGTDKPIDVIEISVKPGDAVVAEQTLIVLESDKATVEVPSPVAGIVKSIALKTGDKVTQGTLILVVETGAAVVSEDISPEKIAAEKVAAPVAAGALAVSVPAAQESDASQAAAPVPAAAVPALATPTPTPSPVASAANVHAGPAVRKLARELGVALAEVAGTGPRARILKDDVHAHVKMLLLQRGTQSAGSGRSLP